MVACPSVSFIGGCSIHPMVLSDHFPSATDRFGRDPIGLVLWPPRSGETPTIVAVLVAHALWSPGRGFCFWAEDSRLVGRARRGDDEGLGLGRHSFAVAADGLGAFLGFEADTVARATDVRLTLLLPTAGGRPLPSGPVRAAATARSSRAAPGLRPWVVPALRLPPGDAL